MGGKLTFTRSEIDEIKSLLRELRRVDSARQKSIRGKLRRMRFHITDFSDSTEGFTRSDVDDLISRGTIKIEG